MTRPIHILGLPGSLRRNSFNTALLRAAGGLLPDGAGLELHSLGAIPIYDGDVDDLGMPEPVLALKCRIAAAGALLLAVPEHNHSIAPALKNALDWASRPYGQSALEGKPVALMGAAAGLGTVRAQLHMRDVASGTGMLLLDRPEVFVGNAEARFDAELRLTDERTRAAVGRLPRALVSWAQCLKQGGRALQEVA